MGAFGACPCTVFAYCGQPCAGCRVCLGTGRVDGGDVEGVRPIVVLRAAIMGLHERIDRDRLREAGILGAPGTGTPCPDPVDPVDRMAAGREARKLLRDLGLCEAPKRKVQTPEQRQARRKNLAAEREARAAMSEAIERRRVAENEKRRQRRIDQRAAAEIAARHPAEFQEEREVQEVFVALETGLPDPSYGLHPRAR